MWERGARVDSRAGRKDSVETGPIKKQTDRGGGPIDPKP